MASLINDSNSMMTQTLKLSIATGELTTDAVRRGDYKRTSGQCTSPITLQVSNMSSPDMDDDTHWYTASFGADTFVSTNVPALWMRFALDNSDDEDLVATEDTPVYIHSTDRD